MSHRYNYRRGNSCYIGGVECRPIGGVQNRRRGAFGFITSKLEDTKRANLDLQ